MKKLIGLIAFIGVLLCSEVESKNFTKMFIESITGVTEKLDVQVQKGCSHIQLLVIGGAPANSVLVTAKIVTKNGNRLLYSDMPILDLTEMAAQDEGAYFKDLNNYVGQLPFAATRAILQLPIAFGGAYQLQDNEYISLDFRALNAGHTYRLSAYESLDTDGAPIEIEKKSVPAPRVQQKWNKTGKFLALTRAAFDKIRLFGNGKNAEFTFEELAVQSFFENDIVAGVTRSIATTPVVNLIDNLYGFDNLLLVNLEMVDSYEVYCTGAVGYTFYEINAAIS